MGKLTQKRIATVTADAAGNTTVFVLSGAKKNEYKGIADALLGREGSDAEQVAFVTGTNSFNMSGMEFCGNAARSFALLSASGLVDGHASEDEQCVVPVNVSERAGTLDCAVDLGTSYTKMEMPKPKRVKVLKHCDFEPAVGKKAIVMDGVVHLIADGIEYTEENFEMIKDAMLAQFDPECLGVLYVDPETCGMTPVIHVKNIGSTYIEGSCGSGTAAFAVFLAAKHDDGVFEYDIKQPGGTIRASVEMKAGHLISIHIEGPVTLRKPEFLDVEFEALPDKGIPEELQNIEE